MTSWVSENGEEWGPWIKHDGFGCPLSAGVVVEVVFIDGFGFSAHAVSVIRGGEPSSWDWRHYPEYKKIVRYRKKKPKGMRLVESRLAELDVPKQKTKVTEKDIETAL